MQSDVTWIKNLARSRFQNGQWITDDQSLNGSGPFGALVDDIVQAVETYNHHSAMPIRVMPSSPGSTTLLTLLHGTAQLKFLRNGNFLDISLLRTRNFQTAEIPLTRMTPVLDVFGHPTWKRGTVEWSADHLIKHSFIHLLEASQTT
jgi:hypothetical protein